MLFISIPTLAWLLGILAFIILVRRFNRLRHIPGPFLAKFTDLWRVYHQWNGEIATLFRALHEEYGPLVRIGPNAVSVGNPHDVPTIYTNRGEFIKVRRCDAHCNAHECEAPPLIKRLTTDAGRYVRALQSLHQQEGTRKYY